MIEVAHIAALSGSERAGYGRAASQATAAQRRTWSAQKICRRGRLRRGKIFEPESCGNEPEAQPVPRQDFRHPRPLEAISMKGLRDVGAHCERHQRFARLFVFKV